MKRILFGFLLAAAISGSALAQGTPTSAQVVSTCGTPPATYTPGQNKPLLQNTSGLGCVITSATQQQSIVPLDASSVVTGGTAVTALVAGHHTSGGFILNPIGATINLCINEQGTASGTTSAGALTCILPGQTYSLSASSGAVSIVSSDSSHPFSGYGLN